MRVRVANDRCIRHTGRMPPRLPTVWSRLPRSLRWGFQILVAGGIVISACSAQPDAGPEADTTPATSAAPEPTVAPSAAPTIAETTTSAAPTTAAATTTEAPADTADDDTVAFAADVKPIIEANCASCHTGDGPGVAHLPLGTAGEVQAVSFEITAAARVGYMPPWPAGDGEVAFHDDRRLTDEQLAVIEAWAATGGEIDVPATTPIEPTAQAVTPIERDVVMVGQPYKGSTDLRDDYRCQIYDPNLGEPAFLQGYGLEADRTEVVHHALLFYAEASTRAAAEQADAADPAVGWECGGLAGFAGDSGVTRQIMSWGPGQDPTVLPADTGIPLQPGDFFVTQIHYHYETEWNDLAPDESAIVIDLASDEVIAAAGGELDPIELTLYLGPAEIPCSTGEVGPLCDRSAMSAQLIDVWGPTAGRIADFLMFQCGATVEDFAGMTNGIASSTCDLAATPGQIVSLWGHMHEIGSSFRMTLNPGTAEERVLLDIPNWQFDWQLDYRPIETIVLEADDTIRVECTWDRSKLEDGAEPRYIMWAEGTEDEMCYSQIVTRPAP
jgi:mono/diheme cytochrome c family protein